MKMRTQFAGGLVLLALALPCAVQASPRVSFVMPQGVDPITKLFFDSNGQQLSFVGRNLLPGNGLELHADPNSRFIFTRLTFEPKNSNFSTQFFIDSFGGDGQCMPLSTPWSGPSGQTPFTFQLQAQTGSIRIGDIVLDSCSQTRGPAYASMILSNADGLQRAFGDEEFLVTAYGSIESVPEGNSLWMLLAGLPVLWVLSRKRQLTAARVAR